MYSSFERCILDFSLERDPGDYWYDCAVLEASDILRNFEESDWVLLLDELERKDIFWKKRLVECLGDLNVEYEIEVILSVINTDDEDLLVSCVDSLRFLDLSRLDVSSKEKLSLKARLLLGKASPPVQLILESFFEKLKN
ncbi:hypothetical protein ACWKWZ_18215 [Metapseudomonas otitidis]